MSVLINDILLWKNGFFHHPRACSNAITGANGIGNGIFTYDSIGGTEQYWFGSFMKDIKDSAIQSIFKKNAADIDIEVLAKEIAIAAQPVIDWVESCKKMVGETSYTVSVTPTPEPESDIDFLFRIASEAKAAGDLEVANVCFSLLYSFRDSENLTLVYEDSNSAHHHEDLTWYDLMVWESRDNRLCIPVPLLKRDMAIIMAKAAKERERKNPIGEFSSVAAISETLRNAIIKRFDPCLINESVDAILERPPVWAMCECE